MERIIPAQINAGLTFSVLATLPCYPAPDWVITVAMRGPGGIDMVASPEGTQHRLEAAADVSAIYPPGLYRYSVRATRSTVVREVETGVVEVLPDLAQLTVGADVRSHARIVLDNIRAVLEKRATQDQEKYRINNRELWRTPLADLLKLEATYAAKVRAEEAAARGENIFGRQVRMRLQ